jgi:peptidoglycan/LPS O-acetylase OafA/YrhL
MLTSLRASLATPRAGSPTHYYSIDFGRGLAALVVLVWHYQHFFFATAGAGSPNIARSNQPFYFALKPFYTDGWYAVQYFWMISGFVFAAVYVATPATTRAFVVHRIARLYPLQLLTLVVVAALQILSQAVCGHEQIYGNNDLWHFLLNLFFASHWGLENGFSFNGPVWSVSIEILIYAVFWVTLPFMYRWGAVGPAVFAGLSWVLHYETPLLYIDEDALCCSFYFFLGIVAWIVARQFQRRPLPLLTASMLFACAGLSIFLYRQHSTNSVGMPLFLVGILLFFCAVEVGGRGNLFRPMRWFGDTTYGTYLWHIPIQISTLIVLDRFVGSREIALHWWFLVAFICLTVAVARLSFIWVERPARVWIQRFASPVRRTKPLPEPS